MIFGMRQFMLKRWVEREHWSCEWFFWTIFGSMKHNHNKIEVKYYCSTSSFSYMDQRIQLLIEMWSRLAAFLVCRTPDALFSVRWWKIHEWNCIYCPLIWLKSIQIFELILHSFITKRVCGRTFQFSVEIRNKIYYCRCYLLFVYRICNCLCCAMLFTHRFQFYSTFTNLFGLDQMLFLFQRKNKIPGINESINKWPYSSDIAWTYISCWYLYGMEPVLPTVNNLAW